MLLLYLSFMWQFLLLSLLASAEPLRTTRGAAWKWPVDTPKNAHLDFLGNGSPLPKSGAGEMTPEFEDALAWAFNFPLLPMSLNRRKHLTQKQLERNQKQLQMHQTWTRQWPSPAADTMAKLKRRPIKWPIIAEDANQVAEGPDYSDAPEKTKRALSTRPGHRYKPSISAGVMTNLGDFFNQLKANVQFAEHSQELNEGESKLLEGLHSLEKDNSIAENIDYDSDQPPDRKKLLQPIRNYRPSQKVRSLVSRNPNGYRGSQFIDPSYMWLGLGK